MSGVGLVAIAFCGGYTVRFGPKDTFAICSLPYGALAYSLLCALNRLACDSQCDRGIHYTHIVSFHSPRPLVGTCARAREVPALRDRPLTETSYTIYGSG